MHFMHWQENFSSQCIDGCIMKRLLIFLLIILPPVLHAQTFEWAQQIKNGLPNSISCDGYGYVYTVGTAPQSPPFGSSGINSPGVYFAKLRPDGSLVWLKSLPVIPEKMATDKAGNTWFVGTFGGTATLGSHTITSNGSGDIFAARCDSSGVFQWAASGGGIWPDYGTDIAIDGQGNCYITGGIDHDTAMFGNTMVIGCPDYLGAYNGIVARYDWNGNLSWVRSFGGRHHDMGYGIGADSLGNCYVTGMCNDTVKFGNGISIIPTYYEEGGAFLVKYNATGDAQWVQCFRGGVNGYTVTTDKQGNVYIGGKFGGSTTIGNTHLTHSNQSGTDGYLTKFDPHGSCKWVMQIPSFGTAVWKSVTDEAGNTYITSNYRDSVSFILPAGQLTFHAYDHLSSEIYIAKVNDIGEVLWAQHVATENGPGFVQGIAADNHSNVYITGGFDGNLRFPAAQGYIQLNLQTQQPNNDGYFAKLTEPMLSIHPAQPGSCALSVYPNPTANTVYIDYTGNHGSIHVYLRDVEGRTVFEDEQTGFSGSYKKQVNIGTAKGIYFLQVVNGDNCVSRKVIVQ
jgi:hypothetical protein